MQQNSNNTFHCIRKLEKNYYPYFDILKIFLLKFIRNNTNTVIATIQFVFTSDF